MIKSKGGEKSTGIAGKMRVFFKIRFPPCNAPRVGGV
jgi:hypothetical protein